MKLLKHLIYYKFLANTRVSTGDLGIGEVVKNFSVFLVYAAFAFGMYLFTGKIITVLLDEYKIGLFLFHRFASIIFFMVFLTVSVGNILVGFSTLYRSKEVNFLLSKPVSFRQVFLIKFFDNFFYSSGTLLVIIFAALLAYGSYFNESIGFYFMAFPALILPYILLAGCSGILILLLLIKIADKIGARITIGVIISVYILSMVLFFKLNDPAELVAQSTLLQARLSLYLGALDAPMLKLFPSLWVADAMYWLQRDLYNLAIPYIIILVAATVSVFSIMVIVADRYFFKSYQIVAELSAGKGKKKEYIPQWKKPNTLFGISFASLIRKETLLFGREPVQVLHLALLIFLLVLFAGSIGGRPFRMFMSYDPQTQTTVYMVFFLFVHFMIVTLALRFMFPHLSLEGDTFWRLRSVPLNISSYAFLKFVILLVIILSLGMGLSHYSNRKFDGLLYHLSAYAAFLATITLTSINFGMGGIFSSFKEKNPIRISSSPGASISFLLCIGYIFLELLLFAPVVQSYFTSSAGMIIPFNQVFFFRSILIFTVISVVFTAAGIYFGIKSYSKDIMN